MKLVIIEVYINMYNLIIKHSLSFFLLVQDQFYEYMFAEAVKQDIKVLLESKPKILLVHSSSGHKQALKEVLSTPAVSARLADTKVSSCPPIVARNYSCMHTQAIAEVKALESFYSMLQSEPDRAYYG